MSAALALMVSLSFASSPAPSARESLSRLAALEGNWIAEKEGSGARVVEYRIVGDGSALLETVHGADRTKILSATLFHVVDGELVADLFGEAGAPSRLRAGKGKAGEPMKVAFSAKGSDAGGLSLSWTKDGKLTRRGVVFKREYFDTLK